MKRYPFLLVAALAAAPLAGCGTGAPNMDAAEACKEYRAWMGTNAATFKGINVGSSSDMKKVSEGLRVGSEKVSALSASVKTADPLLSGIMADLAAAQSEAAATTAAYASGNSDLAGEAGLKIAAALPKIDDVDTACKGRS